VKQRQIRLAAKRVGSECANLSDDLRFLKYFGPGAKGYATPGVFLICKSGCCACRKLGYDFESRFF
jgi:hypothetical protein